MAGQQVRGVHRPPDVAELGHPDTSGGQCRFMVTLFRSIDIWSTKNPDPPSLRAEPPQPGAAATQVGRFALFGIDDNRPAEPLGDRPHTLLAGHTSGRDHHPGQIVT